MQASKLQQTAVGLLLLSGFLHLILIPAHLEEATYLGVLFGAEFVGAVVAAGGIYWNRQWGWGLGTIVTVGSILGYIAIGTIGLPLIGIESLWGPTGVLAKVAEFLFIALSVLMLVRSSTDRSSQKLAN